MDGIGRKFKEDGHCCHRLQIKGGVARVDRRKKTAAKMRVIKIKTRTVKNVNKQAQKRLHMTKKY
jgi:hypothetical protein